MADRIPSLVNRLREKGAQSAAFFRALRPADWERAVYSEGAAWNARQVLCHFVAAERAFLPLFEDVLAGGAGAPEGFDLDRFNESQVRKLDALPPEDLIRQFEAARADLVALVAGMQESDLDRVGRHPWLGVDRLEAFARLIYRHNMLHERDIRRALGGASQPRP